MRLENQRALVTGGATGIGEAIVRLFVEEGASVSYSVLLPGCTVEAGATVRYAILGEGCHIGKNCHVGAAPEECDPDHWGLTVLAPGCRLAAGRTVPAKTMLDRNGEEVSR